LKAVEVARRELRLFLRMAEQTGMDAERQRRSLLVSQDDWHRWLGVLQDEPLPSHPRLPLLLRRLGYLTSRLERAAPSGDETVRMDGLPNSGGRIKIAANGTERSYLAVAAGSALPGG
jgi:hypothetical protein